MAQSSTDLLSPLTTVEPSPLNVPNTLSGIRLLLAAVVCALIEKHWYFSAIVCFLIAVSTDWLDGYWARKYQQITKLGRILDPFVDKIIICGAMIALVSIPESGLRAWIATVVVGRELLVTSLRGMVEGKGGDFSAKELGKWKMVAQCAAVVACLVSLYLVQPPSWLITSRFALIWLAVVLTIISGVQYILIAIGQTRQKTNVA